MRYKPSVYISGIITGDPGYMAKFRGEEERLRSLGYRPVNPAGIVPADVPREKAMRAAVRAMLQCEGVSLLPGWQRSKGARIEANLACALGLDVRRSGQWKGAEK